MNKIALSLFGLSLLAGVGCTNHYHPKPEPQPNKIQIEVEAPPPELVVPPVHPVAPTRPFLNGYNDGYFGTWLAPARWAAANEYRSGWSAGAYDRKHGLPCRYPRP